MVKVKNDLTGQTFERLTVIKQTEDYVAPNGKHFARWICRCSCGNITNVTISCLRSGHAKSCGCLSREIAKQHAIERNSKEQRYEFDGDIGKCYFNNCDEYFLFDTEDYEKIKPYTWTKSKSTGYVINHFKNEHNDQHEIKVHRLIMNYPKDMQIDHINHDKLDNRKCNLRICTASENCANRHYNVSTNTGVRGVQKLKNGHYSVQIKVRQKNIHLGVYDSLEDAKAVRQHAEQEYFGEFMLKE